MQFLLLSNNNTKNIKNTIFFIHIFFKYFFLFFILSIDNIKNIKNGIFFLNKINFSSVISII